MGRILAAIRLRRANRHYAAGRLQDAESELEAARSARPDLPMYRQYRGMLALKLGKAEEAEQNLLAAEKEGGDRFLLSVGLGAAEILLRRPDAARRRFEDALAAFPVAFEIGYHVGLSRLIAGDEKGARADFTGLLCRDDEALFKRLKQAQSAGAARSERARSR